MNFRTTIILSVLVLIAAVFVFVANRGGETEPPARAKVETKGGRKLIDVKTEDVRQITVTPEGGTGAPLQLVKTDGKWAVVQPLAWPAADFEVRSLVDAITSLRSRGAVELTGENSTAAGLDKPRYRIEIAHGGSGVTKLAVGNRSTLGNDLYVRVGDEKAGELAGGGALAQKLEKGTGDLLAEVRDKQLVRTPSTDVKRIELAGRDSRLVLHKDGADWKMTEPQAIDADADEVANVISAVTNLRAEEFADAAAAETGRAQLDKPRVTVTLDTAAPPATQPTTAPATAPAPKPAGKPVTVAFGQPTDIDETKVWVRVSDPASVAKASMSAAALERLTGASPLTLRERKVFDLDPDQVAEVSLSIDRPATTQPATQASTLPATEPSGESSGPRQLRIVRRKESAILGPAMPPMAATLPASTPSTNPSTGPATSSATAPTTSPATGPATVPATVPATAPVEVKPPSKWAIASQGDIDADDGQVTGLLASLHPLRAEKYVDASPTTRPATQPAPAYALSIRTVAPGGAEATYDLRITDAGGDAKPIARYKDLAFEIDRALLKKLEGDFKTKLPEERPPAPPMGFPGMPGIPGM